MNVDSILDYKPDPKEDFYALLGCDSSASDEQILVEFKIRAKNCHPDKNTNSPNCQDQFQRLLQVSAVGKTYMYKRKFLVVFLFIFFFQKSCLY